MATARTVSRWAALLLLVAFLSGSASLRAAAPLQSSLRFVANAGQLDERARYQVLGGAAGIWLDEQGLWVALPAPDGESLVALRIVADGLGDEATLEPFSQQTGHVSYYSGRDPAGWQERLPVWGGVRYRGAGGASLVVRGDGPLLTLEGHDIALRVDGADLLPSEDGTLRVALPWGAATLPLRIDSLPLDGRAGEAPTQQLLYSTYIGTVAWDEATTVARDAQGRIYAAGHTLSLVFPEGVGRYEAPQHAIETFVVRIVPGSTSFDYLLFINSDVEDFATGLVLDAQNRAFVVGHSDSITNFPATPGAFDTTPNGGFDAYVVRVESDGTLGWATLLGGEGSETATAIRLDAQGRPVIVGGTWSADYPVTPNALTPTLVGDRDIFVTRFTANGSALDYSTFIGGTGQDQAEAMALDAAGGVAITGWTRSTDLPVTPGALSSTLHGPFDAFALRLAPAGNALTLATYIGGAGEDRGYAVLAMGNELVLSGRTVSEDFPKTSNALDSTWGGGTCDFAPCPDAFVLRLNATTSALTYGSYLGAEGWDEARTLGIGSDGLYVGGTTGAATFPTTADAFDRTLDGPRDAFLTLLSPDGTTMRSSTYFGGSGVDTINAVWVESGQAWVAGYSDSPNLPTTPNAYDRTYHDDYDAFVAALSMPSVVQQQLYLPMVMR